MKSLITFISLICCTFVFSQKINTEYYLVHSLRQEGELFQFKTLDPDKKGVRQHSKKKFYYWYKAQHVMSTQGGSSGQLLHGEFESFYDNKQLARKGEFRKGLKDGEWLYWRPDGTLYRSEHWKKGRAVGVTTLYDVNGEASETTRHFRNHFVRKTADSLIVSRRDGRKEIVYLQDSLGRTTRELHYKNGRLHGKVIEFENGKKVNVLRYKNGKLITKPAKEKKSRKDKAAEEPDTQTEAKDKRTWKERLFGKKEKAEKESKDPSGNSDKAKKIKKSDPGNAKSRSRKKRK